MRERYADYIARGARARRAMSRLASRRASTSSPPRYGAAAGRGARRWRACSSCCADDDTAPTTVRDPARGGRRPRRRLARRRSTSTRSARRAAIADLGAGAGFPGLVAGRGAARSAASSLVESVGTKCAFMRARRSRRAGLANAEVVCARAEEWRDGIGADDVVTARALAPLAVLVEYAAPLLRAAARSSPGRAAATPAEEARRRRRGGATWASSSAEVRAVRPFPGAEHRHLYLYSKVAATPDRYPRRPGMARKRPLGRST